MDPTAAKRNRMVDRHLVERGIKDPRVLDAFRTVPRHKFLPPDTRRHAYDDESIPIGEGQTITPPYDVAFMTEALQPKPTDKVYEVGTGSGYQAAILSRLVKDVYSVEIHEPLSKRATQVLKDVGYTNVHTRVGDGYLGWPEEAPFDAIIVTCAPEFVPQPLVDQLKEGGRLVIPIGGRYDQVVHLMVKKDGKLTDKQLRPTLFVPMTGQARSGRPPKSGRRRKGRSRETGRASAGLVRRGLLASVVGAGSGGTGRRSLDDLRSNGPRRRRSKTSRPTRTKTAFPIAGTTRATRRLSPRGA